MMGNSIEDDDDDDDSFTKPLGRPSIIYYGMGHMLNDIIAACWFTYLLLFLTDIGLSPRTIHGRKVMFILGNVEFGNKGFIRFKFYILFGKSKSGDI
uniref:Uncharacterized protein n=1 Tax=Quercus lobata TaxID=97700 RepID=A0A7N2LBR1_QUELO